MIIMLVIGLSAGAFTVRGLNQEQRNQLINYFNGFFQLYKNQKIEINQLIKISLIENFKLVLILWLLGATIVGIPFICVVIFLKGFIVGFSSGFIVSMLGSKGIVFSLLTLLPKEIIIIPCLITLCVNGINFSLNIIRSKSIKHFYKENLKTDFLAYCIVTMFFSGIVFLAVLLESYTTPIFVRIISEHLK